MKSILRESFWQLLFVYAVLAGLVYFGFLGRYILHFQIFSIILAGLSYFALVTNTPKESNSMKWLFYAAVAFVLIVRIIPYVGNEVPLGYDPGMYKYIFESYSQGRELDNWIIEGHPPVLSYFVMPFMLFGSWFVLVPLFILMCALVCVLVYFSVRKWFNHDAGLFAALFFAVSYTQYLAFWYNYYKNMLAFVFLLLALLFYKKEFKNKYIGYLLFVICGGLLGGTHLPTFLIFAAAMSLYCVIDFVIHRNVEKILTDIAMGVCIILITLLFYAGSIFESLIPGIIGVASLNIGAGTFVDFSTFELYSLAYFPLALIGLMFCIKKKDNNPFAFWLIAGFAIVLFKLFFFNRYIIHLDMGMCILSGIGLSSLMLSKRWLGRIAILILIISSGYFVIAESLESKPLIDSSEYNLIQNLSSYTESNATILSTHKYYSMWLLGYSGRKVVAPGLFDDAMDFESYYVFWAVENMTLVNSVLSTYPKPLYFYSGVYEELNLTKFRNDECYRETIPNRLFEFVC
jgi:hypothetical protein